MTNLFSLWDAREQSTKSIGAVADAMFYAKSLGRTFVEPAVKDSRTVNTSTPGALPMSAYYNLTAHASYVNILPLSRFQRACARSVLLLDAELYPKHIVLETPEAVRRFFTKFEGADMIVVRGLWRSTRSVNLEHPAELHTGVPAFQPSRRVVATAARIVAAFGMPTVCASWRTERAPGGTRALPACAVKFADSVLEQEAKAEGQRASLKGSVLLSTDLYEGNSGTYSRDDKTKKALSIVEGMLGGALNHALMKAIASIDDSGIRGFVETRICARSDVMIRCSQQHGHQFCINCVKGKSGFLANIERERKEVAKATGRSLPVVIWGPAWYDPWGVLG